MGTEVNGEYGADQIQILEGLEAYEKWKLYCGALTPIFK